MNVTLSIDDEILARSREFAIRRGTSLDQIIRDYLEDVSSDLSTEEILRELNALWESGSGDSSGRQGT
jgi:hypothetical protein